ncbi:hypothetical protein SIID45300_01718 [Candidatus Magnetaquicoccaceae bacterium FCR-1]|uniref:Radical SAM protein n=1 Tax=Candidatus Magnetaquiglobus chichijimensis TaxID=3141448 RepID=A0ABQ0C928_9PROT
MRIAFIVPLELGAVGCRLLSSHLRAHGHETRLIFIPDLVTSLAEKANLSGNPDPGPELCPLPVKERILAMVSDCDLIGFHVLSLFFSPLAEISAYLRAHAGIPVIWGGVHATMAVDLCMPYTDFACIGDGEALLLELLERLASDQTYTAIQGLVYWDQGVVRHNPHRAGQDNLDAYPFPDYSFQEHYLLFAHTDGEPRAIPVTPDNYGQYQKRYPSLEGGVTLVPYKTVSTRGCPFVCTYCSMGTQGGEQYPFRTRSPENIVDELVEVLNRFGDKIDVISISDDTFLSHSQTWLKRFAAEYKRRVKKPFRILGFPLNIHREAIEDLVEAGCMHIGVGVESLSRRILFDVYKRRTKPESVIEAANVLVEISRRHGVLPPTFDVIYSNPYETLEDMLASIRGMSRIRHPFKIVLFKLSFFPNTELFQMAVRDGYIRPDDPACYNQWVGEMDGNQTFVPILYETIWKGQASERFVAFFIRPAVFTALNKQCNQHPRFQRWLRSFLPGLARAVTHRYVFWFLRQEILKSFRR